MVEKLYPSKIERPNTPVEKSVLIQWVAGMKVDEMAAQDFAARLEKDGFKQEVGAFLQQGWRMWEQLRLPRIIISDGYHIVTYECDDATKLLRSFVEAQEDTVKTVNNHLGIVVPAPFTALSWADLERK
ncbi:MAG: hypothetical protein JRN26_04765 [Nitrososphaerota archaeon]|jgi:hypothetical protein|nr:hypothetical protein [Nitrososphaerota archaeon]